MGVQVMGSTKSRRDVIKLLGGVGVLIACGEAGGGRGDRRDQTASAGAAGQRTCNQTLSQMEGPFFLADRPLRSDLTSDTDNVNAKNGTPLRLSFKVYEIDDQGSCKPMPGVEVDVWHADVMGDYSGFCVVGTQDDKSLRGYQITDENGSVEFTTVFAGWYSGRTVHYHIKLRKYEGDTAVLDFTTQLYVDDAIIDRVMSSGPYAARGPRALRNTEDGMFTGPPDSQGSGAGAGIFPEEQCFAEVAAGQPRSFDPNFLEALLNLVTPAAPALTADSIGPQLLLAVTETDKGLIGNFTFGVVKA